MPSGNPGTPRTVGCDEIRKNHIKTRLTDGEVEILDTYAARLSLSRSAAIRSILLSSLDIALAGSQSDYGLITAKCA